MRHEQVVALLAQTKLFGALSQDALLDLGHQALQRPYEKGESIFHQGDEGVAVFVIAQGLVKVCVGSRSGEEMVLATLRPPESFGELAVIDGGPRSASVRAIDKTLLLAFPRETFARLLRDYPPLAESVMRHMSALLRRTMEQASDLIFLDLPGRVAKLLVGLADDKGQPHDDGVALDFHLTQSTLAGMVGGSRPSVNQILGSFQSKGYLELRARQILIKNLDMLRRRASSI